MSIKRLIAKTLGIALCGTLTVSSFSVSVGAKQKDRIESIMSTMTTSDKIAQMIMPSFQKWKNSEGELEKVTKINCAIGTA